jgi:hydroxypyruvate isomerase
MEDFLSSNLKLKGNINHSVCRWCYNEISLDDLCKIAKKLGITSIDLVGPKDFKILHDHNLVCGMVYGLPETYGIEKCFNRIKNHDDLFDIYYELIPLVADAGFKNVICFSGNRDGISDQEGLENCTKGLSRIMPLAEKHNINVLIELLNSKIDHPDYQCDHTEWAVELCKSVGSQNFKILYDVYHMQIMEGNIIDTIRFNYPYIGHYHTGGVPGRNEIDDTQELNYTAIMKAIMETGFDGYVAQEFIPKNDPIKSLQRAIEICDV